MTVRATMYDFAVVKRWTTILLLSATTAAFVVDTAAFSLTPTLPGKSARGSGSSSASQWFYERGLYPSPRLVASARFGRMSHLQATLEDEDTVGVAGDIDLLDNDDALILQDVNLTELSLLPDLSPLRDAITANPPTNLQAFDPPVPVSFSDGNLQAACKTFNYDVGHAGRFTVFGSGGASMDPDAVFGNKAPLSFIQENLLSSAGREPLSAKNELVIFSPGLNTLHEPTERTRTSPMRIEHYRNILGIDMAQVHTGTQMDQGNLTIHPISEDLAQLLRERKLFPEENLEQLEEFGWQIWRRRRDTIQTVLSSQKLLETPIKETLMRLLDVAVDNVANGLDSDEPHMVLMSYSRATVETAAALQSWKSQAVQSKKYGSKDEVEALLRKAVTVVTIGASIRGYPDGPAYIHVSMWQDKLTKSLGPVLGKRDSLVAGGGGKDAVYIHADSPYASTEETNDPHNMGACVGQLLATAMKMYATTSFRGLYNKYNATALPGNITEIAHAMVQATKGTEWLWYPALALVGMPPLPNQDQAGSILDAAFGSGTYNEIAERNKGGMQAIIDAFQVDALKEKQQQQEAKEEGKVENVAPAVAADALAAKYAAIESLEERAYTILVDLGMVTPS